MVTKPTIKAIFSFLCLHLLIFVSYSQETTYSTCIQNSNDNTPIPDAILTIYNQDSLSLGFGVSDELGALKVVIPNRSAHFAVLRKMGFKPLSLSIDDLKNSAVLRMTETAVTLPPVTVTRTPIKWSGDTLVYDAGAFLKPGDLFLKDILKRMPGLTVSENGAISYQGEPIKRFYVEGLDLLGSRYNEATNNLSASAISSVEVLERHQDIRILRGKVPERKASLNIHIKEQYKTRPFGYAEAGLNHEFNQYKGHLNMTHVGGKSIQYFLNAKANNAGNFYEDELQQLNVEDLTQLSLPPSSLFQTSNKGMLPLPDCYYITGHSGTASGNMLLKTGSESTLRINADIMGEKSNTTLLSEENYYSPDTATLIREYSQKSRPIKTGRITLSYEKNTDRVYLKDEANFEMTGTNLLTNLFAETSSASSLPVLSAETSTIRTMGRNNLKGHLAMGSHILNFSSLFRVLEDRGRVLLSETPDPLTKIRRVEGNFKVGTSLRHNDYLLISPELNYGFTNVLSGFSDRTMGEAKSQTHNLVFVPEFRLTLFDEHLYILFNPEINYSLAILSDYLNSIDRSSSRIGFNPEVNLTYHFTPHHNVSIGISYDDKYDDSGVYFPTRIRISHRLYRSYYPELFRKSSLKYSLRWKYKDLYHYFFANLYASARIDHNLTAIETRVTTQETQLSEIYFPHKTEKYNVRLEADKSFPDVGWDLKCSSEYSQNEVPLLLNDITSRTFLQNIDTNVTVEYNQLEKFQLGLYGTYRFMRMFSSGVDSYTSSNDHQIGLGCNISFIPLRSLTCKVKYEAQMFPRGASSGTDPLHIMEAIVGYEFLKKHRIQIEALNILGQKEYVTRLFSPSSAQLSRSLIAPFRVMASYYIHF